MNAGQIIPFLIFGVICGMIMDAIRRNKGYTKSWFWWGFIFQILAILVALAMPSARKSDNNSAKSKPQEAIEKYIELVNRAGQPVNSASWNCICGRQNPSYTGTCACGRTKEAVFEEFESRQRYAQSGMIGNIPLEEEPEMPIKEESKLPMIRSNALSGERTRLVGTLTSVLHSREKSDVNAKTPVSSGSSTRDEETPAWIQPESLPNWTQPEPLPNWTPELFATEMNEDKQKSAQIGRGTMGPAEVVIEEIKPVKAIEKSNTQSKTQPDHESQEENTILTNPEIQSLLAQADQLSTAGEIYSLLRNFRGRVRTQEFDSLVQEIQNDAAVERAYGNNKSTAMLHIDLYRNNSGIQTTMTNFG